MKVRNFFFFLKTNLENEFSDQTILLKNKEIYLFYRRWRLIQWTYYNPVCIRSESVLMLVLSSFRFRNFQNSTIFSDFNRVAGAPSGMCLLVCRFVVVRNVSW